MTGRTRRLAVDPRVIVLVLLGAVICLPHLRQMKRVKGTPDLGPLIIWLQKTTGAGALYEVDNSGGWAGLYKRLGIVRPSHNTVSWPPEDMSAFRLRPAQAPQPVAWPPSLAPLAFKGRRDLLRVKGVGRKTAANIAAQVDFGLR
ncbi:MAG TPA: hypothetical protein ENK33_08130 [Desulfobacterales bacterium]|nr:hypothetical protein [Desulfobacterales bacterium]